MTDTDDRRKSFSQPVEHAVHTRGKVRRLIAYAFVQTVFFSIALVVRLRV